MQGRVIGPLLLKFSLLRRVGSLELLTSGVAGPPSVAAYATRFLACVQHADHSSLGTSPRMMYGKSVISTCFLQNSD